MIIWWAQTIGKKTSYGEETGEFSFKLILKLWSCFSSIAQVLQSKEIESFLTANMRLIMVLNISATSHTSQLMNALLNQTSVRNNIYKEMTFSYNAI